MVLRRGGDTVKPSRPRRTIGNLSVALLIVRTFDFDCTLQPRLVPCWNLCYRDCDRHVPARAAKYDRRHGRSHAFAIQFKMRSETRCRASGLLAEQTRDSKLDIYTRIHTHTDTHLHIRTRVSGSSVTNVNRSCIWSSSTLSGFSAFLSSEFLYQDEWSTREY